jgi:PucR C-terminal helix-turn-helix domain/GGDEF-like domain
MRPELQDIVDEVSRLLSRPATLEDRSLNLVAFCSHGAEIDDVRQRSILQRRSSADVRRWFEQFGIARSDGPVRTPSSPEHGVLARLCLPARWNGVTYGYLWLIDDDDGIDEASVPAGMVLAERAGALMAQQARAGEELDFKVQDLLSTDTETVERAANEIDELGIIRRGVPVAAVDLRLAEDGWSEPVPMKLWTLPRSVLTASGDHQTTLLVPLSATDLGPARDVAQRAMDLYAERLDERTQAHLVAGVGAARSDLAEARSSWREARLATRVVQAVPALRPIGVWPELGIYRLLGCGQESALASAVLDPAVLRLLDHRDPDLRDTAVTYLDQAGNVQQTAATLSVHRQTVYHRLQRIERVTGLDLTRGDQRLLLHLGLTMAPLLARSAPES